MSNDLRTDAVYACVLINALEEEGYVENGPYTVNIDVTHAAISLFQLEDGFEPPTREEAEAVAFELMDEMGIEEGQEDDIRKLLSLVKVEGVDFADDLI